MCKVRKCLDSVIEEGDWNEIWSVSIFDHFLSKEESDDCQIFNYLLAKEQGAIDKYLTGENNFINLYSSIADEVIIIDYNIADKLIQTNSAEFIEFITKGLRKESFFLKYTNKNILVQGGYDRTDIWYINENSHTETLENLIKDNNLFLLEKYNYEQLYDFQ